VQSVKTIGVLGVLGGMSGVASGKYYRLVNARLGGHAAAEVLLYSVDFAVIEQCIRSQASQSLPRIRPWAGAAGVDRVRVLGSGPAGW
jgi:aspartate/glutamate racemase